MPPAARMGDSTAHGGVITLGAPTVMIGGMMAARLGDMHTCPMVTPPGVPHVGGPILKGCPTVMIAGMPAAAVGDQCTCVGPPDAIMMGCMTVMIGGGGGGGGAGGGGDSSVQSESAETEVAESHFIDVSVVDAGGNPITGAQYVITDPDGNELEGALAGRITRQGVSEGSYEVALKAISLAQWSADAARTGDTVTLKIETAGIDSGKPVILEVWQKDINRADRKIHEIRNIEIQGDAAEADWEYQYTDNADDRRQAAARYSSPSHYFVARVDNCQARSGILRFKDFVEIELIDQDGHPVANQDYILYLPSGDIRRGTLDGNGYKKEENIPPGQCRVEFPGRPQTRFSL